MPREKPKSNTRVLKGWGEIKLPRPDSFCGSTLAKRGDASHSRRPVRQCITPEGLTAWVGEERGQKEPVHIASEGEDLLADLKQGLSRVRQQRKTEVVRPRSGSWIEEYGRTSSQPVSHVDKSQWI